jgi:hypothetical protein
MENTATGREAYTQSQPALGKNGRMALYRTVDNEVTC